MDFLQKKNNLPAENCDTILTSYCQFGKASRSGPLRSTLLFQPQTLHFLRHLVEKLGRVSFDSMLVSLGRFFLVLTEDDQKNRDGHLADP